MLDVILPTYNRAFCIEKTIDSILNQTSNNWHLTIVDDASTDGTVDLIQHRYGSDVRVTLHVKSENMDAPGIATNYGIERTNKPYLTVIDSDDIIVPDAFSRMLNFAKETPRADLVYSKKLELWGNYDKLSMSSVVPYSLDMLKRSCIIGQLCIYTRDLYIRVGGFNPEFKCAAEYDLYLRMAISGASIKHYPEVLYHINRLPGHISRVLTDRHRVLYYATLAQTLNFT